MLRLCSSRSHAETSVLVRAPVCLCAEACRSVSSLHISLCAGVRHFRHEGKLFLSPSARACLRGHVWLEKDFLLSSSYCFSKHTSIPENHRSQPVFLSILGLAHTLLVPTMNRGLILGSKFHTGRSCQ